MGMEESGMWTPHSLAPGLLQNVLVLMDLNFTCFQLIHYTEITCTVSIGSAVFCLSILFVQGFLDRDEGTTLVLSAF